MSKFESIKVKNGIIELDAKASVSLSMANQEEYHELVDKWSKKAASALRHSVLSLNAFETGALHDSIKPKIYKTGDGDIWGVGFNFDRQGIYVHKGAGTGMGGQKGSSWLDKYGQHKKTNPDSLGKLASGNRKAKRWTSSLDQDVQELADIVAEIYGDRAVEMIRL